MSEFKDAINPSKKAEVASDVAELISIEISGEQIRNRVMSEISGAKKG